MRHVIRRLLVAVTVTGVVLIAAEASAAMSCSGPYYDSRSWNSGLEPHSGGCFLSSSVCYECWNVVTYESAGCEWGTGGCESIIDPKPFRQVAKLWLIDPSGAVTAVCLRRTVENQLDESDLV